ncbi:hypothetical protein LCGC14_1637860 [marine sediment metagenome]|uniref:Uncharacterized protein n=1 Tax=marine sediment metagenome TaxID=412755 RepID=A0A0F9KGC3_9ZZZZ
MSFTYNPTLPTDRDKVRLKIRDTDTANPVRQLWQDEEITAVLAFASVEGDLNLAAAELLEALAVNAALLHKLEALGDYKTDTKGMAEALLKSAALYRALAEEAPAFEVAEHTHTVFSWYELLDKSAMRRG